MKQNLVIQLARFGDLVQTKRLVLSLLREENAELHLCLDESLAPLARLVYPAAHLHPVTAHGTGLAKLPPAQQAAALLSKNIAAFGELAALRPDAVYNLNFSPLNFRVASLFDPGCVRGHRWSDGQEIIGGFAELAMRWSGMRRAGVNIADFWAGHHGRPVSPQAVNPAAQGRGGGLGVVMAGRESRRSLPPKVLAELVSALQAKHGGCPVTLFGSAAEAPVAHALLRELPPRGGRPRDLCGKTNWANLHEEISRLDLLLTPDTGTMHLAAHLGVPVLGCFLSSAWCFETGPYGQGHRVLQAELDCLPCLESEACARGVECLNAFSGPALVRYLHTDDPKRLPAGLIDFSTAFDSLGLTFAPRAGTDPHAELRSRLRAFLAWHLQCEGAAPCVDRGLAERLYQDRDWLTEHGPETRFAPNGEQYE